MLGGYFVIVSVLWLMGNGGQVIVFSRFVGGARWFNFLLQRFGFNVFCHYLRFVYLGCVGGQVGVSVVGVTRSTCVGAAICIVYCPKDVWYGPAACLVEELAPALRASHLLVRRAVPPPFSVGVDGRRGVFNLYSERRWSVIFSPTLPACLVLKGEWLVPSRVWVVAKGSKVRACSVSYVIGCEVDVVKVVVGPVP